MNRSNDFLHTLKASGYRITAQRRVICEFLVQADLHPTPYQVYAQIASNRLKRRSQSFNACAPRARPLWWATA